MQGGSLGGLGRWRDVCDLKNIFYFFGLPQYFDHDSSFHLLFLRVACECNRPSLLATVFYQATAFNGDLHQWDVAKVTAMHYRKSICIVENALA
jgi:hypothetical protein